MAHPCEGIKYKKIPRKCDETKLMTHKVIFSAN